MPCYCPITGYRAAGGAITFKREASLSGVKMMLPCGRCVGCRMERARQWAMRCMHEARMHRHNCFVTLTYDDGHLPEGRSLVKRDFQLFMKRLRFKKGSGVRFFGCGEYGEINLRPHYHVLLFNCKLDMGYIKDAKGGQPLYVSPELYDIWDMGHHFIAELNFDTASYVARYSIKKVNGERAKSHYEFVDSDGVIHDRLPEFGLMSRRPGIGHGYYELYGGEVRAWDNCVVNGRECKPPRFYDGRTEKLDVGRFEAIKRERRRKARLNAADNTSARLRVKEVLTLKRLEKLERKL